MSDFLVPWQSGKKTTWVDKQKNSTLLLYLFDIREVFLSGTPKSSTAFFTVYRTDSDPHESPFKAHRPGYLSGFYIKFVWQVFGDVNISFGSGSVEPDGFIRYLENYLKVVGNEKKGGSERCQTITICLWPRRSMFFSLLILLSSLILCISVSAPVKQNQ